MIITSAFTFSRIKSIMNEINRQLTNRGSTWDQGAQVFPKNLSQAPTKFLAVHWRSHEESKKANGL